MLQISALSLGFTMTACGNTPTDAPAPQDAALQSAPTDAGGREDAGRGQDASASEDAGVNPQMSTTPPAAPDLPTADPASEGVGLAPLIGMTNWVASAPSVPVFSLLLSRHGSLVYELYTPGIERPEAHFMMSTSKSVTSAIVGAAIDRGYISGPEATVADLLPAKLFATPADATRFGAVTLKDVMGMSALAADEPPRDESPSGIARGDEFAAAANRVTFALTQQLLPTPGVSYQYNDITPMLAGGAVQYATGKRLFDFGNETIFAPLGFENAEWFGEDPTGLDLAAYGLRLRPLDMQKFGMLYLDGGRWNGKQVLSSAWVSTSLKAWMNTGAGVTPGYDNYGYYWWHRSDWGPEVHWTNGWRGQFIVDIPAYDAVFSMTADIETGDEEAVLANLITTYVVPALTQSGTSPALESELATALATAHQGASRVNLQGDPRMIPSAAPIGTVIPFQP